MGFPWGWLAGSFAWYFKELNLLLTNYITGDSRIMMRRTIQDRVRTIAPLPPSGPRPLSGDQQRAALLDPGCLHDERLFPLLPSPSQSGG